MASCRLVDEVEEYNKKLRNGLLQGSREKSVTFRNLKELTLSVNRDILRGKTIVFMKPHIDPFILKIVVAELEGLWVTEPEFMRGRVTNFIIAARFCLQDRASVCMTEEELWKAVFPYKE
jgi:hypothetical protein